MKSNLNSFTSLPPPPSCHQYDTRIVPLISTATPVYTGEKKASHLPLSTSFKSSALLLVLLVEEVKRRESFVCKTVEKDLTIFQCPLCLPQASYEIFGKSFSFPVPPFSLLWSRGTNFLFHGQFVRIKSVLVEVHSYYNERAEIGKTMDPVLDLSPLHTGGGEGGRE